MQLEFSAYKAAWLSAFALTVQAPSAQAYAQRPARLCSRTFDASSKLFDNDGKPPDTKRYFVLIKIKTTML